MNQGMAHWGVVSRKVPKEHTFPSREGNMAATYSWAGCALHKGPSHPVLVQISMLCMKLSSRWQQRPNKITQDGWSTSGKGFFICPKLKYKLKVVLGEFREDCIPVGDESDLLMPLTFWAS